MVTRGEHTGPEEPKDASGAKERKSPAATPRYSARPFPGVPSIASDIVSRPTLRNPGTGLPDSDQWLTRHFRQTDPGPGEKVRDGINDSGSGNASGQEGQEQQGGLVLPSFAINTPDGPVIVFGVHEPMTIGPLAAGSSPDSGSPIEDLPEASFFGPSSGRLIRSRMTPSLPGTDEVIARLLGGQGLAQEGAQYPKLDAEVMQAEKAEEDASYKKRIAGLNGLRPEEVKEAELKDLYRYRVLSRFTRVPEPTRLLNKYVGKPASPWDLMKMGAKKAADYNEKVQRARGERFQDLAQLTEGLLDLRAAHYSYGLFTPTYTSALLVAPEQYADTRQNHKALLVGALTRSTIDEFSATIKMVHPDATTLVTDIEGETTAQVDSSVATFLYGDARRLPVADGSVDSIHTNILAENLKSSARYAEPTLHFLQEAHRALAPTGQLIMVESNNQVGALKDELLEAGFTDVVALPALRFNSRRAMDRSLVFKRHDPTELTTETAQNEMVIIATKQPAGTTRESIRNGSINF